MSDFFFFIDQNEFITKKNMYICRYKREKKQSDRQQHKLHGDVKRDTNLWHVGISDNDSNQLIIDRSKRTRFLDAHSNGTGSQEYRYIFILFKKFLSFCILIHSNNDPRDLCCFLFFRSFTKETYIESRHQALKQILSPVDDSSHKNRIMKCYHIFFRFIDHISSINQMPLSCVTSSISNCYALISCLLAHILCG